MIQATCRDQLTADDFAYVVQALAKSPSEAVSLVRLLTDTDTRDAVLDHDLLYARLLEDVGCLKVSPALYFYVLTRRVLRRTGLEERALCDYIAGMLTAFSRTPQLGAAPAGDQTFFYLSDLLDSLDKAPASEAFIRRRHLGDYSLFISGIFSERIRAHAARRGAPGLSFYESIGRTSYRGAAHHPQARRCALDGVLEQIAEEFHVIRAALQLLTENLLHVEPPTPGLIRVDSGG